ncbi:hypothetical protein RQP46_002005 [Phenoliferia psychrophenolica]
MGLQCRYISARQDRTETTSLASPLGESYRLESALAFRTQILSSLIGFLGFATIPPTSPDEHIVLFLEFEFALDAPDLRTRWKLMGIPRIWKFDDWLAYLLDASCDDFDPARRARLYASTRTALDDIPKVRVTNPSTSDTPRSPYIITMANFRDLPYSGEIQNFMSAYSLLLQAPCATGSFAVDWLTLWKEYITKTPLLHLTEGSGADRSMGHILAATRHFQTTEPHWTAAKQHWESLPIMRRTWIMSQMLARFGMVPKSGVQALAYAWLWKWGEDTSVDLDAGYVADWMEKAISPEQWEAFLEERRKDGGDSAAIETELEE